MRTSIFCAAFLCSNLSAQACIRSPALDFASQVNSELSYLVCLHNEQNSQINSQNIVIRSLEKAIEDRDLRLRLLEMEVQRLSMAQTVDTATSASSAPPQQVDPETDRILNEIQKIIDTPPTPIRIDPPN